MVCINYSNACLFTEVSEYIGYLPQDVLGDGVKTGKFVQGFLQVSKSNASLEAFVRRSK
ncbi:hypothetical protein DPMN_114702 [Dreissena polymorpha]|uniref:Uncharacterized protein n=1 Tax=Dreissena polymorpha TaxID=45954 RepID=A0A9D4QSA5_DREPO|nr:hypothetical protein DPMN_114702 [Dreissena polymorpha]